MIANWILALGIPAGAIGLGVAHYLHELRKGAPEWTPLSQFWAWRWMFWRRVRCHVWVAEGVVCNEPAVIKCVYVYSETGFVLGDDYARDPLCAGHGQEGECGNSWRSEHVLIPKIQRWTRVHLRLRLRFEKQ